MREGVRVDGIGYHGNFARRNSFFDIELLQAFGHDDESARVACNKPRAAIPCAVVGFPHNIAEAQERQYAEHDLIAPVNHLIAAPRKRERRRERERKGLYEKSYPAVSDKVERREPAHSKNLGNIPIRERVGCNGIAPPRDDERKLMPRPHQSLACFHYLQTVRFLRRHPRVRYIENHRSFRR